MEKLSMCRVCLATEVRLCSIASHLRDMFERISSITLKPQDVLSTNTFKVVLALHLSLGPALQDSTECHISEDIRDAEFDQLYTEDIETEAKEEQFGLIEDNNQSSHLKDPLDIKKEEADDVETDAEYINLEEGNINLEEIGWERDIISWKPDNAGPSSQFICPKIVKVVLERIDLNDSWVDIETEAKEEQFGLIEDNNQSSHLKDPLDIKKEEADDVETDAEYINLEEGNINLEEIGWERDIISWKPDNAGPSSQFICPKIVKVVLERIDLNDSWVEQRRRATEKISIEATSGKLNRNKEAEADIGESRSVGNNIVTDVINKIYDKLGSTMFRDKVHDQTNND